MNRQILFEATDPRGKYICCSTQQWNEHVIGWGHQHEDDMTGREKDVVEALEDPSCIHASSQIQHPEREVYHGVNNRPEGGYIRVVVGPLSQNEPEVVSAFAVRRIGGVDESQLLYIRSKPRL